LRRVEEMQRQVMEQLGEIKLSKGGGRRTSSATTTTPTTATSSTPRETQLEVCVLYVLYACMQPLHICLYACMMQIILCLHQ
jgi:hypothetical protein